MAFKNEYVPPLEQEISAFFRQAQKTLNVTAARKSKWTIDRERDMVLVRTGGGHSIDAKDEDYWSFLTRQNEYSLDTELLMKAEISKQEIAITRLITFRGSPAHHPSEEVLSYIKDALREYKDWGTASDYLHCHLRLIDGKTGEEI